MTETGERAGIACVGNWIIDHVKTISTWPQEDTLASILAEERGTGGSAYNVLVDLARFHAGVPLYGIGLVGDDADGEFIIDDCYRHGIDAFWLQKTTDAPTAYTDVMTVKSTGRRTFFHQRGANALLKPEHVPVIKLPCKVVNIGYLLLLDGLDSEDAQYGTVGARLLADLRSQGMTTSIDVVSEDSDRFERIVTPALRQTDCCVINEIEAGRTVGRELRPGGKLDRRAMEEVACQLIERGVGLLAIVHAPELSVAATRSGKTVRQPSLALPDDFIAGTAGAGDAFLAGVLLGLHADWPLDETLRFATAAAASCLRHPTTTGGVGTEHEIHALLEEFPFREDGDG